MKKKNKIFSEMDTRAREVFQRVVESYLETGEPIGSRTLTRSLSENVSAATIRNVMQDLEYMGVLGSPHISAGRVPTESGLRLFVDGILETQEPTKEDRQKIESTLKSKDDVNETLNRVSNALSGISMGASLVLAPKHEAAIKHVEFVQLTADRSLAVLVYADGQVENRIFRPPVGQTQSQMREAINFINAMTQGRTLEELKKHIQDDIQKHKKELNAVVAELVESGIAVFENANSQNERLMVRGRSNLLEREGTEQDLVRVRQLFDDLERKRDIAEFLDLTQKGEGVRIFIGSENKLFSLTGSSLVVSPYMNSEKRVIGAVGVIGPTRLNYGRIIPLVNYTAHIMGRFLSKRG